AAAAAAAATAHIAEEAVQRGRAREPGAAPGAGAAPRAAGRAEATAPLLAALLEGQGHHVARGGHRERRLLLPGVARAGVGGVVAVLHMEAALLLVPRGALPLCRPRVTLCCAGDAGVSHSRRTTAPSRPDDAAYVPHPRRMDCRPDDEDVPRLQGATAPSPG
ncbi:Serine/threonine-protein kinase WNK2, partial [Frankliniella fusca]